MYNWLVKCLKLKEDLNMVYLLTDYDSVFAIKCGVMHELIFCSQYLFFKLLACACSLSNSIIENISTSQTFWFWRHREEKEHKNTWHGQACTEAIIIVNHHDCGTCLFTHINNLRTWLFNDIFESMRGLSLWIAQVFVPCNNSVVWLRHTITMRLRNEYNLLQHLYLTYYEYSLE